MDNNKHKEHLAKADPILGRLIKQIELQPLKLRKNYFEALIRAIANQQLSGKAAQTILNRVVALFKSNKFPTPQEYLKMSDTKLRSAGFSNSKVVYTKNVARFFIERDKEIKKVRKLTDDEVVKLLTEIKGIGVWSAEMFMIFSLGREDVFSYGDLGLRNGIKKVYSFKKEPTIKQVQKIVESWKPYRTHGARYMWASLSLTGKGNKNKK
ncbi:MAG: DNA-3-methyladenine glycosylase [bacterium]|nr:DNA-3-methyladenine glycosylase [bacterium]